MVNYATGEIIIRLTLMLLFFVTLVAVVKAHYIAVGQDHAGMLFM